MQRRRAWLRLAALAPTLPPLLAPPGLQQEDWHCSILQNEVNEDLGTGTHAAETCDSHSSGVVNVVQQPASPDTHSMAQGGESIIITLPVCESEDAINSADEESAEAAPQSESEMKPRLYGQEDAVNCMDVVYDIIEKCTRKAEAGAQPAWIPVVEAMRPFSEDDEEINAALNGWESMAVIEFTECVRFSRHAVRPADRPLRCYVCGLPRPGPPRESASGRSGLRGRCRDE